MPPVRRLNVKAAAQRARTETPAPAEVAMRIALAKNAKPAPRTTPAPARPPTKPVVGPVRRSTTVSLRAAGQADPTHEAMVNDTISTRTVSDPARLAHVRFGAGLTINLGNFESARIDVQVELPCDMAEVTPALEEATEFVHARLAEEEARWATPK